jgi:hypothetical protein
MTKADDTLDVHMELHHHNKNFGRSITIKYGNYAKSHYTIQKSHKIAKIPNIPKNALPIHAAMPFL